MENNSKIIPSICTTDTQGNVLSITRVFSSEKQHPYSEIEWSYRTSEITGGKGQVIFRQDNIEVPTKFSDLAVKILASKYFHGDI